MFKIPSITPNVFVSYIPAFANSCCKSWNEFYFPERSDQVKQFTAVLFQWKIHACNESQRSWQLFCHISFIQICNTTWDNAGDMPSVVTEIIAAGRNWTIDYNACDVVSKVFTCIKTAWKHVCDGAYDHYDYMETRLKILANWKVTMLLSNVWSRMRCRNVLYFSLGLSLKNIKRDWIFGQICAFWRCEQWKPCKRFFKIFGRKTFW